MRNVSLLAVWMAIVFALPVSAEPFDPSQFPSTLNAQGEELTLNGIALIMHYDTQALKKKVLKCAKFKVKGQKVKKCKNIKKTYTAMFMSTDYVVGLYLKHPSSDPLKIADKKELKLLRVLRPPYTYSSRVLKMFKKGFVVDGSKTPGYIRGVFDQYIGRSLKTNPTAADAEMKKSLFKRVFDDLRPGVIEDFPYSLDSSGKGSTALPDGQHLDEEASRDFFGMWVSGDKAAWPLQNVKQALLGNHG